jgi:hypothetical protein
VDAGVVVKKERRRMLDTWKSEGIYPLSGGNVSTPHSVAHKPETLH